MSDTGCYNKVLPEKISCGADEIFLSEIEQLRNRSKNVLEKNALYTMKDLIEYMQENDIGDLRNAGKATVENIREVVFAYLQERGEEIELFFSKEIEESQKSSEAIFQNLHFSNEKLSIRILINFKISQSLLNGMEERRIFLIKDLVPYSKLELKEWFGRQHIHKFEEAAEILRNKTEDVLAEIFLRSAEDKERGVFLRRAKGETLQEIAENPNIGEVETLTRERIRQIEKKYHRRIADFVSEICTQRMKEKNYLPLQEILEIYDDDDSDALFLHSIRMSDQFEYLDFAEVFVPKGEESQEARLLDLSSEFIGEGIDLYEKLEDLEELLFSNGFEYIGIGEFLNLLRKYKYHVYGDFVVKEKQSYGFLCANIIKKYFPNGIKLNQNDNEKEPDLMKLRELVQQEYGDLTLPESDRALSARIADYTVLCDRGKVISIDNVQIDEMLLAEIKDYIDKSESDKIFYVELFAIFEKILREKSNIDNYNFLHGVLMLYYPQEYSYTRDALIRKQGVGHTEVVTVAQQIREFIKNLGRPVHKNELKKRFIGFSDIMLLNPIAKDRSLISWEYNHYFSMDLIDCNRRDQEELWKILLDLLEKNDGYSSSLMYYLSVRENYGSFLEKNKIDSDFSLFYIASSLFEEKCDFRRPHIALKGRFMSFQAKDLFLDLMNRPEKLSYSEYQEFTERMKWSPVTAGGVFYDIEKDYCRISQDEYLLKKNLHIDMQVLEKITSVLEREFVYGVLPLDGFRAFEDLPLLDFLWNEFLLGSLIEHLCSEKYLIVTPNTKDRRFQKGIVTRREEGLISYDRVVAHLMRAFDTNGVSEGKFLSFLISQKLTRKNIPKELTESPYLYKSEGCYFVKTEL